MSQQMSDQLPTMNLGGAPVPPPAGMKPPRNNRPLILGLIGGCLVLILLFGCGGAAAYFLVLRNQAAQVVPTFVVSTITVPTITVPTVTLPTVEVPTLPATEAAQPTAADATSTTAVEATGAAPTATEGTAAAGGVLAFASNRSGDYDIYVMDVSAPANVTDLTKDSKAAETQPAWSPDGAKLAFVSDRSGASEIYVMNADGSGVTQLTHDKGADTDPNWSSDGTQIAFTAKPGSNLDVYIMNADGSNSHQFTSNPADDYAARWSPDGKRILFLSNRDGGLAGTGEIYVRATTGPAVGPLLAEKHNVQGANWSPVSQQVIFSAKASDGDKFQIYTVNADKTGLVQLTKDSSNQTMPAVSPDGKFIVFVSDRTDTNNLFIMSADGSNVVQLTNSPADNIVPTWKPIP